VGYDGSSTARAVLESALRRGPVTAVYAWDSALRGRDVLKQLGRDAGDGGDVEFDELNGPPAEALVLAARARDADAIVVGSRGLGPVRGRLGSVTEALLHEADVPVVVVLGLGDVLRLLRGRSGRVVRSHPAGARVELHGARDDQDRTRRASDNTVRDAPEQDAAHGPVPART
jgi:Universal stress protein family